VHGSEQVLSSVTGGERILSTEKLVSEKPLSDVGSVKAESARNASMRTGSTKNVSATEITTQNVSTHEIGMSVYLQSQKYVLWHFSDTFTALLIATI